MLRAAFINAGLNLDLSLGLRLSMKDDVKIIFRKCHDGYEVFIEGIDEDLDEIDLPSHARVALQVFEDHLDFAALSEAKESTIN